MSSNEAPLPDMADAGILPVVSDEIGQRDVGEIVATTSAAPSGRRADEEEPKTIEQTPESVAETEPAGRWAEDGEAQPEEFERESSLSETAQGGPSDISPNETKTPADSIKSHRDFEAFLRTSGFSRAASKALASGGWQSIGEPETDAEADSTEQMARDLLALFELPKPKG